MHELLRKLGRGDLVLDLGCAGGSFNSNGGPYTVIRIDLEKARSPLDNFAQADAARLPFRNGTFAAVVSNHSLEHIANLDAALEEIGRVVKPGGALYAAVPDASTLSDRLYRWLARGGRHVNPFRSAPDLAAKVERKTGLRHVATRTLCTSLSCFHRENRTARAPRRMWLIGGGTPFSLHVFVYGSRMFDRLFRTRLSVYGWALYFGGIDSQVDRAVASNVCIRCGAGHCSEWLREHAGPERRWMLFRVYRCPGCRTPNLLTDDRHVEHLES